LVFPLIMVERLVGGCGSGDVSSASRTALLLVDPNTVTATRVIDAQRQILRDNNWIYHHALQDLLGTLAAAAKQFPTHRSFEITVPQGCSWMAEYNHVRCIEYCIGRLRTRGFNVIVSPNVPGALVVQWQKSSGSSRTARRRRQQQQEQQQLRPPLHG